MRFILIILMIATMLSCKGDFEVEIVGDGFKHNEQTNK